MIQILPFVIEEKNKNIIRDYGDFFMDYDGRDDKTNFAIKLPSLDLPDFGSSEQNLRGMNEVKHSNSNINRIVYN